MWHLDLEPVAVNSQYEIQRVVTASEQAIVRVKKLNKRKRKTPLQHIPDEAQPPGDPVCFIFSDLAKRFTTHWAVLRSAAIQHFFKAKKWNIVQWPSQSPGLNPIEIHFTCWRKNFMPNQAQTVDCCSKGLPEHHEGRNQHLVISMSSNIQYFIYF